MHTCQIDRNFSITLQGYPLLSPPPQVYTVQRGNSESSFPAEGALVFICLLLLSCPFAFLRADHGPHVAVCQYLPVLLWFLRSLSQQSTPGSLNKGSSAGDSSICSVTYNFTDDLCASYLMANMQAIFSISYNNVTMNTPLNCFFRPNTQEVCCWIGRYTY